MSGDGNATLKRNMEVGNTIGIACEIDKIRVKQTLRWLGYMHDASVGQVLP
jgi:hypothetical protein